MLLTLPVVLHVVQPAACLLCILTCVLPGTVYYVNRNSPEFVYRKHNLHSVLHLLHYIFQIGALALVETILPTVAARKIFYLLFTHGEIDMHA